MTTVADILRGRADSDATALLFGEDAWTYREVAEEAGRRAALFGELRDDGRPPHIGVLLENVPDYLFWLAAAALSGGVLVGINATYRGEQLGLLVRHTDCQLLVTASGLAPLLDGVDTGVCADRMLMVDAPEYAARLAAYPPTVRDRPAGEDDLLLLIFTSGSTGLPKAVRCTQGRLARTGAHVATIAGLSPGDAVYAPLPFFHSSSLFTGRASAISAGVPIATRAGSRRRRRSPTSAAPAPRCSLTPGRSSTTSWPPPSGRTT